MSKSIVLNLSSEEFDFLGLCLRTCYADFCSSLPRCNGSIDFNSLGDKQKEYYFLYESIIDNF